MTMVAVFRVGLLAAFLATPVLAADFAVPLNLGPTATIELTIVASGTGRQGRYDISEFTVTTHLQEMVAAGSDGYRVLETQTGPEAKRPVGVDTMRSITFDTDLRLVPK